MDSQPPPPLYTPSAPSPSYSCQPLPSERRLDHTLRPRPARPPTGAFIAAEHGVSVVFDNQDPSAPMPTYGRNSHVAGAVCIEDTSRVTEVTVKLEGTMHLTVPKAGSHSTTVVHIHQGLWHGVACPPVLPFELLLPPTFTDGDRPRPLPPSFETAFPTSAALGARVTYTLTVVIASAGQSRLAFWPHQKSVVVPLHYAPRSRPPRPMIPCAPLFSSLKLAPEEWQQVLATIHTDSKSGLTPITAHLFLPSVQVFALSDTIPYHVQLAGAPESLHALAHATVRVLLRRQVAIIVNGVREWRNVPLGEGKLVPLPPRPDTPDLTLDWEGVVRCRPDEGVGGFNAGELIVKDFIVLEVEPPPDEDSPLLPMQCAHPVRIVSDPWIEIDAV